MNSNLKFLLKRYINKNITEIFNDQFGCNFQFIYNIDLKINDYIMIFYKNTIIIICIDIDNKDIINTLNEVINLKKEINNVFIINIDTKYFNNKDNCVKIDEIKLKINTMTLKNDKIYELFISADIYDHLIMLKNMINKE